MERKQYVDYAKALCIVFVVLFHVGFSEVHRIFLFVLPLFFAATGYTFSYGKRTFGQSILVRFKSIMIPYFGLMIFYTLIEMVRAGLFSYGDISIAYPALVNTIYGSGIIPVNGGFFDELHQIMSYKAQPQSGVDMILPTNCHLWFLPAMFCAYALFAALVNIGRRSHPAKILLLVCLVLAAAVEAVLPQFCQLPFGLGRGALGAAFMLFGFWMKDYQLLENKLGTYVAGTNLLALALFIGALCLGSDGSIFVRSVYGPYGVLSVFVTFIGGAAGVWLVLSLCKTLEQLPMAPVKKLLSDIGQHVMTIYVWHMAVKFVFDVIYICLIKASDFSLLDEFKMGLMPQTSLWFMVFETIAVIAVCLFAGKRMEQIKYSKKAEAV